MIVKRFVQTDEAEVPLETGSKVHLAQKKFYHSIKMCCELGGALGTLKYITEIQV